MNRALKRIHQIEEASRPEDETVLDAAIGWRGAEDKGRGVFARRFIRKGEIVECAPVIPVAKENVPEGAPPDGYVLEWDAETEGQEYAIVLGYIMLYNHGENPNLYLETDLENQTITASAIRDIEPGEEMTWNYNCELWFDPT